MNQSPEILAAAILRQIGGTENVRACTHCTTRLRLELEQPNRVEEGALLQGGVLGVFRRGEHQVQLVLGPQVLDVARAMTALLGGQAEEKDP